MKVTMRPARALPKIIVHRKVAAYCRVSTQQEIQHHSLEAQREYYEKRITGNSGWEFVGIYTDQASGRNNLKMHDFQRMMEDCHAGKIDLIITKSISRLGRNTLQFLNACEELKSLNVDVLFEVEKLYLHNPKAVRLLTIYASVYQNESEVKSAYTRWGIRTRYANGTSATANLPCYGYRRDVNGELVIEPAEAVVVRMIYDLRNQGLSLREIAHELKERTIPSPSGKATWGVETVRRILQNEKYKGHVLLQKTYVSNFFTGKRATNNGELPKYLLEGHHEAIIKPDEFPTF
jgi:DNA invertase Pin-like site-specific DNA recombinase